MMVTSYQRELAKIKEILKENPKGMTVTDISRKIKINRNSVAKYLDIMKISGHVEMITFGPAKVFFPSRRIPISKMLNFASDYIIVFDSDLTITLINDAFLSFLDLKRDDIIGKDLEETILKIFKENIEISIGINEALKGKKIYKKIRITEDKNIFLNLRIIPTTFENGKTGVTLIMNPLLVDDQIIEEIKKGKEKLKNFFKI